MRDSARLSVSVEGLPVVLVVLGGVVLVRRVGGLASPPGRTVGLTAPA